MYRKDKNKIYIKKIYRKDHNIMEFTCCDKSFKS